MRWRSGWEAARCATPLASRSRSRPAERDELVALVSAALSLLEHDADPAHVELVVEHARFERRPLLGEHRVCAEQAQDLEVVLGLALVVLLATGQADARVRRHVDARLRSCDARAPRPARSRYATVAVERRSGLAVVPDVALGILGVPVRRPLGELSADEQAILDDGARLPRDHLCAMRHCQKLS